MPLKVGPAAKQWADSMAADWDFKLIAPAHFEVRPGTPADLKAAFAPTLDQSDNAPRPYDAADDKLLEDISGVLRKLKVI